MIPGNSAISWCAEPRASSLLLATFALTALTALSQASAAGGSTAPAQHSRGTLLHVSHSPDFPNYDIRLDKTDPAIQQVAELRERAGVSTAEIAARQASVAQAVKALEPAERGLVVEYAREIHIPQVISPDTGKLRTRNLMPPTQGARAEALRTFIKSHGGLFSTTTRQADDLRVVADYENPAGNLGFALLQQEVNGIPVFQGQVQAAFRQDRTLFRIINRLAPAIDDSTVFGDFGEPENAVSEAFRHIDGGQLPQPLETDAAHSNALRTVFGSGDFATVAEKVYFPLDFGVLRPAWKVLVWQPVNAYYVVVDAQTGILFWRKNITEDQTEPATFEVYRNSNAFIDVADSPAPLSPGPASPSDGTQGALLTRENVVLIGNENELAFNNTGWIADGTNSTSGNAVEAGVDINGVNGVDAPVAGTNRVFSSAWNPPPGNPAPGDLPSAQAARDGAVIQMFYVANRFHDIMYQLGFTEQAFNFQRNNFLRGGAGNDHISAEAQDSSGVNNANFSSPADGIRGRLQVMVFNYANPDRDGTADAELLIHELTHGLSNRLHGNSSGLNSDMARAMGEGWSDFYAHTLLAEPADAVDGIYSLTGYLMLDRAGIGTGNFYYGIRSLPKAILSSTGGPAGLPYNPLTFRDIDPTQAGNSDGAFPARFPPDFNGPHFRGEVWSSALWEIRALMIQRLGFEAGTWKVLQIVTDGMKLSPPNPTFLQARDAIIAAAYAGSPLPEASADVADVWEGFRIRGMGYSARIHAVDSFSVTEAFDLPNASIDDPGFTVSDQPGDNDSWPEAGEPLSITIPLKNTTGELLTSVNASINGGQAVDYGDIEDHSTVTRLIAYSVPDSAGCGELLDLEISISSNRGTWTETRRVVLGEPADEVMEHFDAVTAPALPSGWLSAKTGSGVAFVTTLTNANSAPHSAFTPNTGGSGNAGATLDSPPYSIAGTGGRIRFQNRYNTEADWDGGVLEISINDSAFADLTVAGGLFIQGGYNGMLGTNQNPLDGRPAWTGNSGGYITTTAILPGSAYGQDVRFRWRFGQDTNTAVQGWNIDDVSVFRAHVCNFSVPPVFKDGFESGD